MPTNLPRITFTVSEELMQQIEEFRYENRQKNQTQAIVALINKGLEALSGKPLEKPIKFTEDEVQLIGEYRIAEPMARDMAHTTLKNFPKDKRRT